MFRSKLRGFTLVELLVVIAMIGILVSMMLPAIQSSREAARRNMCLSNMRNLILAVHNYEMAKEAYPAGSLNESGPIENIAKGQQISWLARLLPYVGEQNKFANLDLEQSAYSQVNDDVRRMTIPAFSCPTEVNNQSAMSSYAGNHHGSESPIAADNNGIFFLNSELTGDDLKDGAQYTIFIGEKITIAKTDLGWLSGTPATLRNAGAAISQDIQAAYVGSLAPWLSQRDGEVAEDGSLPRSLLGGDPDEPLKVGGFGSFHVGGANFGFGDGSVRFLDIQISEQLLQQLCNRSDGALIDGDELQ